MLQGIFMVPRNLRRAFHRDPLRQIAGDLIRLGGPINKAKSRDDELILAIRAVFEKVHVHVSATEQSVKALRAEALTPLCRWRAGER
jgi:hypothetical protein